jgi:hypothetical protein
LFLFRIKKHRRGKSLFSPSTKKINIDMKILFVIYLVLLSFICRVHAQENSGLTFGQVQPIWSKYFKPKIWEHKDVAALTVYSRSIDPHVGAKLPPFRSGEQN